jgi:hypothetical protein
MRIFEDKPSFSVQTGCVREGAQIGVGLEATRRLFFAATSFDPIGINNADWSAGDARPVQLKRNVQMKKTMIVLAIAMMATPALAQSSASLSAGFTPDPYTVDIMPGGGNDASDLGNGCNGMIAGPPDFQLNFEAGGIPLYFSVSGSTDTTLVINTPSGQYVCDDDSAGNLNPQIAFSDPESGVYDVWVGAIGDAEQATLLISESN